MPEKLRQVILPDKLEAVRLAGKMRANAEDASLWRWFAALMERSRIRLRYSGDRWLVSVDHRYVSSGCDFDASMRVAKASFESMGLEIVEAGTRSDTEDGALWRWLTMLIDDSLIRWHRVDDCWLAIVARRRLSTRHDFDRAIRAARAAWIASRAGKSAQRPPQEPRSRE